MSSAMEAYYMTYIAIQPPDDIPRYRAHVLEIFVKAEVDAYQATIKEVAFVNWLPKARHARLFRPQPGMNKQPWITISESIEKDREIYQIGFIQITPQLYAEAVEWTQTLNSGAIDYKLLDRRAKRRGTAMNCIGASALGKILETGANTGLDAALMVMGTLEPHFVNGTVSSYHDTHPWINAALGLDSYRPHITPTYLLRSRR
jgi:hypothetical protein